MTSNYLTTCYRSHSVVSSTKANLKLSTEKTCSPYLIIGKSSSLEFFLIKANGEIEPMFEYQLFANILYITTIPSYSEDLSDHLFILTRDNQFSIASVNESQIVLDCYGDINYRELEPADTFLSLQDHVICSNHCIKGYLGFLLYKATLIVIPWKMNEARAISINKVCRIRLTLDLEVISLVELGSTSNIISPKNEYFIGGLFQQMEHSQSLPTTFFKIYKLEDTDGEIKEPGADEGWAIKFPETIHKVIFMKGDRFTRGLLAFGLKNVYFYLYETKTKYEKRALSLNVGEYVRVPNHDNFLLLSDQKNGSLFLLVVDFNDLPSPIEIKHLGRTSLTSTLQYLDKKMVFVGSKEDNSCVLRILDSGKLDDPESPYLSVVRTFHNLGNITGIDLIENRNNHTKKLILASPFKQESLNLFQKGVNMGFSFVLNIPAVIDTVSFLRARKIVILGMDQRCIILHQNRESELAFIKIENFPVMLAFESEDHIVAVSSDRILNLNENFQAVGAVEIGFPIIFASKSSKYLCICHQEPQYLVLSLYSMAGMVLLFRKTIAKPISALFNTDTHMFIGFWQEGTLGYYTIDHPEYEYSLELGSSPLNDQDFQLKNCSVSSIELWQEKYLLLGLNNGNLIVKELIFSETNQIQVVQTKISLIGDRNIRIVLTKNNGILVYSDQLFVLTIQPKPENLVVEKFIVRAEAEAFNSVEMEGLMENEEKNSPILAVIKGGVAVAELDRITRYMISPFGEDSNWLKNAKNKDEGKKKPQKCQLAKELVTVGFDYCITANNCVNDNENLISEIVVYSLETQEILDTFTLQDPEEQINNLLYDESQNLLFFTTDSLLYQQDVMIPEISTEAIGRIYLFYLAKLDYPQSYSHKLLTQITKIDFRSPIESLKKLRPGFFTFFSGSMLYVYELVRKDKLLPKFDFVEVFKRDLKINAFQLDVYDEYLLLSDPYKNLNLYHCSSEDNKLLFIAKVFLGGTLCFSSFYAKEKVLCFDDNGNMVISQRKRKAETDLEKTSLQVLSGINLGEKVTNAIKVNDIHCEEYRKILKKGDTKPENYVINEVIWTSESGSIGVLADLPRDLYQLLMDLQESVLQEIKGKGYFGFEYEKWRQMRDQLGNRIQMCFVDGEIVRQIGHLPLEVVEKILNRMSSINKPKLAELLFLLDDLEKKLFS